MELLKSCDDSAGLPDNVEKPDDAKEIQEAAEPKARENINLNEKKNKNLVETLLESRNQGVTEGRDSSRNFK